MQRFGPRHFMRRAAQGRLALALLAGLGIAASAGAALWWFTATGSNTRGPVGSPENGHREAPPPAPWFQDVTGPSGIDFTHRNGEEADRYTILESLGGGVGLIDFDRDGLLDVFVTGGGGFDGPADEPITGHPSALYRNLGGFRFEDVTFAEGLDALPFYTHGCAAADYDRDGWPDLLVTGYGRLALYHNEEDEAGRRRFREVTAEAGLNDQLWSTGAGWGDLDGDGDPDLYVCHYVDWSLENDPHCTSPGTDRRDVCPPQKFRPLPDTLYRNEGDGTFTDASDQFGLRDDGCGLGVLLADLDGDARPDVYVANDATENFLYFNRDGRLEERGGPSGVAVDDRGIYNGSMGVDAADFDGSGRASLWVTNFQDENHALYLNLGSGLFTHHSKGAGIAALGQRYVGFGTGFHDFDNDGWEDLVIANGHVLRQPRGADFRQRAVLLHNVARPGRRFFEDVSEQGGAYFQRALLGRGLAIGDLDNDGWSDLVVSHTNSPVVLLRNAGAQRESSRWLGIELEGRDRRDLAGTMVTLETGERTLTRFVKGGGSYLSSGDRRLLFGLGSGDVGRVTVRWSWGQTQEWDGLEAGAYWRLVEGSAEAERVAD